ncbi:hypothetical protein DRO97_06975 [Archaeoglobales archaeon]|nr:MAG: hypothetical protein DRO97_06975 [Archaeoglobales archaeon]
MYDFLRFIPENIPEDIKFGFENYVIFSEKPDEIPDKFYKGYLIKAENVNELISKLRKVKKSQIVGVLSSSIKVNREAIMRKKVDVLLDGESRKLDYVTIKLAVEKDVIVELSLSKYLNVSGFKRTRLFEEDVELIRIINKFNTPFVITSAASNLYEMRIKKQIYDFFSFLDADTSKAEKFVVKLIRKYYDPNYIMDGLEILK